MTDEPAAHRRPQHSAEKDSHAGFTVVLCDDCEDDGELPILAVLRETIRRSSHGVLVRARCSLGRLWCHARKTSGPAGRAVLVQPCTSSRTPLGTVILVGPVRTADDLAALARWLQSVPLTVTELPPRLCQIANQRHPARRN